MKLKNLLTEASFSVSQKDLLDAVKMARKSAYIKNVIGAIIPTKNLTAEELISNGAVDSTGYSEEYLNANPYTLIQFDAKTQDIDMYQPNVDVLKRSYKEVQPNGTIISNLKSHNLAGREGIKYVVKKDIVMMAKADEMGYTAGTIIESPWNATQTIESGGYVVDGNTEAYIVNAGADGNPAGYMPA